MNMNLNLHFGVLPAASAASHFKGAETQAERSDVREQRQRLRHAQIITRQQGVSQVQKSDNGKGQLG